MSSSRPSKRKCIRSEKTGLAVANVPPAVANPLDGLVLPADLDPNVLWRVAFHACPSDPQVRFVCKDWNEYLKCPSVVKEFDPLTKWELSAYKFVDIFWRKGGYSPSRCAKCNKLLSVWDDIKTWRERYEWPGQLPAGVEMPPVTSTRTFRLLKHIVKRNLTHLISARHLQDYMNEAARDQRQTFGLEMANYFCECDAPSRETTQRALIQGGYLQSLFPGNSARDLCGTLTLPISSLGGVMQVHFVPEEASILNFRVQVELIKPSSISGCRWDETLFESFFFYNQNKMAEVLTVRKVTTILEYVAIMLLYWTIYRSTGVSVYSLAGEPVLNPDTYCPLRRFLHSKTPNQAAKWIQKFQLGPLDPRSVLFAYYTQK
jgi:hypothetical protein